MLLKNIFFCFVCFPVEKKPKITALLRLSWRAQIWWIMLHNIHWKGKRKRKKKRLRIYSAKSFHNRFIFFYQTVSLRKHIMIHYIYDDLNQYNIVHYHHMSCCFKMWEKIEIWKQIGMFFWSKEDITFMNV